MGTSGDCFHEGEDKQEDFSTRKGNAQIFLKTTTKNYFRKEKGTIISPEPWFWDLQEMTSLPLGSSLEKGRFLRRQKQDEKKPHATTHAFKLSYDLRLKTDSISLALVLVHSIYSTPIWGENKLDKNFIPKASDTGSWGNGLDFGQAPSSLELSFLS